MNAEQLAYYFVTQILEKQNNSIEARINRAFLAINGLLQKGWQIIEIKEELDAFKLSYPQIVKNIYHIEEIMGTKEAPSNLMDRDVFYYHNQLRVTSPPVKIAKDENGQWKRHEVSFFLEMKPRYSMDELLAYWYNSNGMQPSDHNRKQDKGRFEYLLGLYDLDEILFMIDIAYVERRERNLKPLRNAFELEKFIDEARDAIKAKKNVHRIQGIDTIVARKGE